MSNLNELKRLESDMKASEELRKNLDEAVRRIAAEGKAQSDGEVMVAAAKELGYDITIAALEQARAESEALDPEALKSVAGGMGDYDCEGNNYMDNPSCDDNNYMCFANYHDRVEDEDEHGAWCFTAWHCFAATLHTDQMDKHIACWSDYKCMMAWE